jgi:flagellin
MTVINTNIKSLVSQNAMVKNNRDLSSAMEQLSTGKRINSAADDAAGLAISSRMTSQIRGLDQAVRNGNDSVSMLQTTEGAMIEMTNMLQRMRELSIQSSNDTYTENDRGYLDLEFQQLKTEVNRITRDTQWNGMDILNGAFKNDADQVGRFRFQVGSNEGQVITHTISAMGFQESTGAATLAASDLTLTGNFSVGDKLSVTVGTVTASYTVSGNDLLSGESETMLATIAANMATKFSADLGQNVSAADGVLTFETPPSASTDVVLDPINKDGALTNIKDTKITTNSSANDAIEQVDIAINRLNTERAGIGAIINRITYAVDNLTNISQNTSESRSRIMDADYAKASSELARTQIISQAATAMLAQANQQPQSVMQLLQG